MDQALKPSVPNSRSRTPEAWMCAIQLALLAQTTEMRPATCAEKAGDACSRGLGTKSWSNHPTRTARLLALFGCCSQGNLFSETFEHFVQEARHARAFAAILIIPEMVCVRQRIIAMTQLGPSFRVVAPTICSVRKCPCCQSDV